MRGNEYVFLLIRLMINGEIASKLLQRYNFFSFY